MTAEDLLRWAYGEFGLGDKLCLTCSWQKQSSVLVHMVSELGLDLPGDRARHAALLPRVVRDARPPRRALRAGAHLHADADGRGAAPPGGAEPLGARPRPLLSHPQGRAAAGRPRALRRLDLGHQARPVAEPRRDAEAPVVGALRCLEAPPARRLGREAGLGLHQGERHSLQPAARGRVPFDRLHPVHPADLGRRGRAGRPLGRL